MINKLNKLISVALLSVIIASAIFTNVSITAYADTFSVEYDDDCAGISVNKVDVSYNESNTPIVMFYSKKVKTFLWMPTAVTNSTAAISMGKYGELYYTYATTTDDLILTGLNNASKLSFDLWKSKTTNITNVELLSCTAVDYYFQDFDGESSILNEDIDIDRELFVERVMNTRVSSSISGDNDTLVWLDAVIHMAGGLNSWAVDGDSLKAVGQKVSGLTVTITGTAVKVTYGSSSVLITDTTFNNGKVSVDGSSLNIPGSGTSISALTTAATYNSTHVQEIKYLYDNFDEEFDSAAGVSTKSGITVDTSYLSRPDTDDYVVYYNASYALNNYAANGSWGDTGKIIAVKTFADYKPSTIDESRLLPDAVDSYMSANLWLHQELFNIALGSDVSWPVGETYTKPTRLSVGDTNKLTEDEVLDAVSKASAAVEGASLVASAQNISLNYDNLVRYATAELFDGINVVSAVAGEEVNLNDVKNNVVLDSLRSRHYTDAKDIQPRVSGPLPIPSKIPDLDSDKLEVYYDLIYYTLVSDGYLASNYLSYQDGVYTCQVGEDIKALIDGKEQSYINNLTLSSKQAKFIKGVLALYDGMEYLGINKDYSKSVKVLMDYYDTCNALKDNETLDKYSSEGTGEPLKMFFSATDELLSSYYQAGVAVSASYIPLQTNLYYPESMAYMGDSDFIKEFHYKYGFYRKALYIDNSKASAVDDYITDLKGTQRVAKLRDLFSPESDIILYVDNNFYNADLLAEKQEYVYDAIRNTESSGVYNSSGVQNDSNTTSTALLGSKNATAEDYYNAWSSYFQTLFDVSFENIIKTGSVNEYSIPFFKGTSKYGDTKYYDQAYDLVVWDDYNIDSYLDSDEYSVAQAYAVVSSIYKNTETFNLINNECRQMTPVFVSSPTLAAIDGISQKQFNTIYNYLMLKNLENNLGYDYKSTIDMDSPIFIDIYGNIVTESGLVVIPAASNATLVEAEDYTPWTAGFLSLYAEGYHLDASYNNSDVYMNTYFTKDEESETWILKAKIVNNVYMNFSYLPMKSEGVMEALVTNYEKTVTTQGGLPFSQRAYLITEVMRGAPLENIDYEKEGINVNRSVSKVGLAMAYKLDDLVEQFLSDTNGNSLVTLPNLAFIDGVEYIVLFLFKAVFAILMLGLVVGVYRDCVSGTIGIKSAVSGVMSIVLVIIGVTAIPDFLDYSYYTVNKVLLKDEVGYIAMLNLEKKNQGKEVGVGEVVEPQSSTELYVKLDNISIPWYEMLDDVLLADTFETATQMYRDAFEENPMSTQPMVTQKSDGLYISTDDIFDSSTVGFSLGQGLLYQSVTDPNVFSYVSNYYVILDQLIANVNAYNLRNDILNYSTEISRDGSVKTTGMISSYFLSDFFMGDNYDILGLHTLYEDDSQKILQANPFSDSDINRMRLSLWYPSKKTSTEITSVVDELDLYAKNYVLENKELLEKVSDETFLKIMALQISLEHNRMFHTRTAQTIEIFNIDSKDLLRLVVGDKSSVFRNSSYTFARYVYEDGGTFSVIMMGCLVAVVWLTSLLKPLIMIVIMILMILSLVLRKILFQKQSRAYEGYFISMGCFCGCNIIYALMLKCSISITDWLNVQPSVSIILGLVVQIIYVLVLLKIIEFQIKDWRSLGFNEYAKATSLVVEKVTSATLKINEKIASRANPNYGYSLKKRISLDRLKRRSMSGEQILESMKDRDDEREDNIYDNKE